MYISVELIEEDEKVETNIDTENAIELTSDMSVSIDGKQCIIRIDPTTGMLNAYPTKDVPEGIQNFPENNHISTYFTISVVFNRKILLTQNSAKL